MANPFPKNPPPTLTVYWKGVITDTATGKVVRKTRKYRARSFHNVFLQLATRYMFGASAPNVIDIDGNTRNPATFLQPVHTSTVSGHGFETEGIVCGTSSAAVDAGDYYLTAVITDGTGSGQLSYGNNTTSTGSVATGSSITSFDVTRPIANSSGGTITVEEIGLVMSISITAVVRGFMYLRDLTGGVDVGDGQTLTVTYTITTTA